MLQQKKKKCNCDNILRTVTPQYTTKRDFPAIMFAHRRISFLIRMHNYTKIKGLESGKITSLPNSQKRDQLTYVISVIAEYKPHAHHETRLHTTKPSRFLSPVSTVSAKNAWDDGRPIEEDRRKKTKKASIFRVTLKKQIRLITNTKHQGFEISKKIVFSYPNCHASNMISDTQTDNDLGS